MTCSWDADALARGPRLFGRRYLSHYFTTRAPPFHTELARLWQRHVMKGKNPLVPWHLEAMLTAKGRRLAIAAPRGHAKSTIMSLQNVLHAALYGYKRYIVLVSDTEAQAAGFLEAIKAELEFNEDILADFGPQKGRVWKHSSAMLQSGVRIDAMGSGQNLRGRRNGARRPDLIVLDDIENDAAVRSPEGRARLADWYFGAVSKAGDSYTDILCIGTVLHHDSLLSRLMDNPAYRAARYRAVERFSSSPLWDTWRGLYTDAGQPDRAELAEAFFKANRREMLQDTQVLWPRKLGYYDLMCMMVSEGEGSFYREMQNEPTDPESHLFPRHWLRFYDPEAVDFRDGRFDLFGYCDPSLGKSGDGDFSAIITLARCGETGRMYVIDADIARRHPDAIIGDILSKAKDFRRRLGRGYTLFGAESNQFQWFLKEQLAKESARQGVWLPLQEVYSRGNKTMRIQTLQPDIKNGYLLFDPGHGVLIAQLTQFPHGRYDDGPDALEGAVSLCKQGGRLGVLEGLRV